MSVTVEFTGYLGVELVQAVGDDHAIANAARVSTGGVTQGTERDGGLIRYLMKHRHGSPFEHNSMTFRIEAPIFVFREWMRHRIGWSYNEESGRYKELEAKFYEILLNRPIVQSGSSAHPELTRGTPEQYALVRREHEQIATMAYASYQRQLEAGIAREVARNVLPVAIFSSMYVTCNARSLMAFLSLRTDEPEAAFPSKPQWEIDQCARQLEQHFMQQFPLTHAAFDSNGRVAP